MGSIGIKSFVVGVVAGVLLSASRCFALNFSGFDVDVPLREVVSYDDNITYTENHKRKDFVFLTSIGIKTSVEKKSYILRVSGSLNRQIFAKYSEFNNTSETFDLNFEKDISLYDKITVKNSFIHSYEPRSFEDAFGSEKGRYSYYKNKFSIVYERDFSKRLNVVLGFKNSMDEFSRNDITDTVYNEFNAKLRFIYSSMVFYIFSYRYKNREYDIGEHIDINSFSLGARKYFNALLYLDLSAGIDSFDNPFGYSNTFPSFDIRLTNEINPFSQTGIGFSKGVSSTSYNLNLFDKWQIDLFYIIDFSERLRSFIKGFIGKGEYKNTAIEDKLYGVDLRASFLLSRRINVFGGYRFSRVISTDNTREYKKNSVFLGAKIVF